GQQESTLLWSYIKAAKLKYWLNRPSYPPVFREVKWLFDRFVSPSINANPSDVSEVQQAVLHTYILHEGSIYTHDSTHVGNSLILYYPGSLRSVEPTPGTIKYIFETEQGVCFAIRHYLPLHSHSDPFRHYPQFLAHLFSSALAEHLTIIMPEWVVSHFAW
ncbi:hypothetical protein DFH29DRAFT_811325, partial [Suillus ampliporus]